MQQRNSTPNNNYRPQTVVKLVKGGKEYFDELYTLITNAKESIHLQMYTFSYDETGRAVISWLKDASAKGIRSYLLFDGYATQVSQELLLDISGTMITIARFQPLLKTSIFYIGRRLHHKIIVADGKRAMVGSNNINNHYRGSPANAPWLDMALYVEGSIAAELKTICIRLWNNAVPSRERIEDKIPVDQSREGSVSVRIRINDWARLSPDIRNSYFNILSKAQKHVFLVSSYFLPGRQIRRQIKLAAGRGVSVTVITAGLSDVGIVKHAERYLYSWLLRNGIALYEYQNSILHAKLGIRDSKWLTIGSFNINDMSNHASIELNLDVRNKPFVVEVVSELNQLIQNGCRSITVQNFSQKQTFLTRIVQKLSYNIVRLAFYLFAIHGKRERTA